MKFKLNCSPYLRMHEITKKLFNNNFLSDIRFSVGDKIIYAHSLELMKRSFVFEEQLDKNWGKKQIISITHCTYDSFHEFIRFLYTDECTINTSNGIELLKLANHYEVIILENRIINLLSTVEWIVQLFEHCVIGKYEAVRQQAKDLLAINYGACVKTKQFLALQPDVISKMLQFDYVEQGVTEFQIFDALASWIQNYCTHEKMSLTKGRLRFDDLMRQIRFPTMSNDEVRQSVSKYPDLLLEIEDNLVGDQLLFWKTHFSARWISSPRKEWEYRFEWCKFKHDTIFTTTFTVSKVTILHALWAGIEENRKEIEIEINETDNKPINKSKAIKFTQFAPEFWQPMLITLGNSIRLQPNFEYIVAIKYLGITNEYINVVCRTENVNLIFKDPETCIQILKASGNMLEMVFKATPD